MNDRKWLAAGAFMAALAAMLILFQPGRGLADGKAMLLPVDPTPLTVATEGGERSFHVEIADEPAERAAGLMFREDMADDHGMLFVFQETRDTAFWMKNTPMPLDLVFAGEDGRVRAVLRGEPQSEAIIDPGEPVRFVLELKAGTAAREGIGVGDLLRHPAIAAARSR